MSNHPLIQFATQPQLKTARGDHEFKVGDGVKVFTKVREGDKERTQLFAGIVIQRKGGGIHETFTVGEHEWLVLDVFANFLNTRSRHRILARVGERDIPLQVSLS